jgi:hypothetical protein
LDQEAVISTVDDVVKLYRREKRILDCSKKIRRVVEKILRAPVSITKVRKIMKFHCQFSYHRNKRYKVDVN